MGDGSDFPFRAPAQIWIHIFGFGNRDFRDFIDGRRGGFLLPETVAVTERLESIHIHCFHDVTIQVAQARVRVNVKAAGQQLVQRLIELFTGLCQTAGAKVLFARIERGLALRGQPLHSVRGKNH